MCPATVIVAETVRNLAFTIPFGMMFTVTILSCEFMSILAISNLTKFDVINLGHMTYSLEEKCRKLCPIGMFPGLEILLESWNFLNIET